eukprot:CAMPEP_0185746888 /NCGR_PEP_ID=MMETSP1174-20130828/5546_1 /TAXON_ID=35687 /ORGANISM="Dictyocha speculum, Strain CCMP1381" /LENGTH=85 /DNA_ID=CAMNT_0028421827 /DNA_START=419 /DNA_END=673 /DNA_ORIENTATION=-
MTSSIRSHFSRLAARLGPSNENKLATFNPSPFPVLRGRSFTRGGEVLASASRLTHLRLKLFPPDLTLVNNGRWSWNEAVSPREYD